MINILENLDPRPLWKNFELLTRIPRPSKKEEKVINFLKEFALTHRLEIDIDEVGNVIIRKGPTSGMENRTGIILQGHLDMVPQKNSDIEHNFEKDPIKIFIEGDLVKARGTTLGADNGIGLAAMLAILEANEISHGPIEALFTIDEEAGMTGAFALKPGILKGEILLNLDSEDEGEICIGCAGGINTNITFNFKKEEVPNNSAALQIDVSGLKGGHSGVDIAERRGNSNKIINRILWKANKKFEMRLASFNGGNLRNAIPREASAVITILKQDEKEFTDFVNKTAELIKSEFTTSDSGLKVSISSCQLPPYVLDKRTSDNLLNSIYACPNGVMGMVVEMPDIVETSNNLAIVKTSSETIEIHNLQRSAKESLKENLANMIRSVFELAGASDIQHNGSYPGWTPNVNSQILNIAKEVYNNKFNRPLKVSATHGGLECGLLGSKYPNLDSVSFGPTISDPHSPDESVNIPSVKKFWDFLLEILKNTPVK